MRVNATPRIILSLFIVFSANFVSALANAQDRGTGFPTGSQDTKLPSGTEIERGDSKEVAETAFKNGLAALVDKDYARCRKEFQTVVDLAPTSPEANYYLGVCTARDGKPKRAVKHFNRAIEELPDFVEAREQLALVQIRLGNRAAAELQLEALRKMQGNCSVSECDPVVAQRLDKAVTKIEAALS